MTLRLFNTLTKTKEDFAPLDAKNVRMYVCGPTVYDFAHIGNARPSIVFDVLFRLLCHEFGDAHVTYVRNITDVDDKINARAAERGISIRELTEETARIYAEDVGALGCLPPTVTPRATEHIVEMVAMIEDLITTGHAYAAEGHVLFDVSSKSDYGKLSRRSLDEMIAGARVEVAPYKKGAMDFVLWKPSDASAPGWESPWGRGRPGWHIECSAMAGKYLGETFDIHGGGIDLMFPHHENEIAQSEGVHHGHPLAKVWMHNGFLQLEGEKMSKSAGNFFTIRELLADWPGEVLRFNMLRSHYRQPIDFTLDGLRESWKTLERWYETTEPLADPAPDAEFLAALHDDLNTPAAIASLHRAQPSALAGGLGFLGFSNVQMKISAKVKVDEVAIADAIAARKAARAAKDFAESDRIRDELLARGIVLKDGPQGTTWEVKKMSRERLYIFDTTLRDGAQTQGVDFSVEDKRQIALALDGLGIDYVEGGWPGANPTDTAFFAERPPLKRARFTAFGMTKRSGRSAANDPALAQVLGADVDAICLVGKSWDYQVDVALEIPRAENVDNIARSIEAVVAKKREPMLDAEHFFDGYKANPDYAMDCIQAAHGAGARWIVLCDTNGGTLPDDVYRIVSDVKAKLPGAALGIHAHDDTGQGVAVSLAALRAGVRQIQGTLNGLGERCGNANLCTLLPTLLLKEPFASQFETGVSHDALAHITHVSRLLDEILNRAPGRHSPYVGLSAFAHKGGLHSSAVLKDPRTYEHVPPETVGNKRVIPVSDQSGRSNVLARLAEVGIDLDAKDARVSRLLDEVKRREYLGYAYDGAEASFELMARRALGQVPDYFIVDNFRVSVERRRNARGEFVSVSEGVVKLDVAGQSIHSVATGNGPVNALDAALRKDLGKYSAAISDLRLADYKVRILTTGTEAVTRVMIESIDGKGQRWSTVGVSANIVDASFEALTDSITYKLYKEGIVP